MQGKSSNPDNLLKCRTEEDTTKEASIENGILEVERRAHQFWRNMHPCQRAQRVCNAKSAETPQVVTGYLFISLPKNKKPNGQEVIRETSTISRGAILSSPQPNGVVSDSRPLPTLKDRLLSSFSNETAKWGLGKQSLSDQGKIALKTQ